MKGFSYPAPSGTYKVCVNRRGPWQHYDTCRLQISVSRPNYEGEKFKALCEWSANRFKHTVYIVSDTLQRHNIILEKGVSHATAWKESRAVGDEWMNRNAEAMALARDHTIIRWDSLLNDPRYVPVKAMPELEEALTKTIQQFWVRRGHEGSPDPQFVQHCRSFLLEELAVFGFLFEEPAIDIYAGSWFKDLMAIQFPKKDYLAVDFTKNKLAQNKY